MPDAICFDDLDEFGRETDDEAEILYQDVIHMLLESFGTNVDAPDRSIGLEDALSGAGVAGLRHLIETKLESDARIDKASAVLTDLGGGKIRVSLTLEVNGAELGMVFDSDGNGLVTRVTT